MGPRLDLVPLSTPSGLSLNFSETNPDLSAQAANSAMMGSPVDAFLVGAPAISSGLPDSSPVSLFFENSTNSELNLPSPRTSQDDFPIVAVHWKPSSEIVVEPELETLPDFPTVSVPLFNFGSSLTALSIQSLSSSSPFGDSVTEPHLDAGASFPSSVAGKSSPDHQTGPIGPSSNVHSVHLCDGAPICHLESSSSNLSLVSERVTEALGLPLASADEERYGGSSDCVTGEIVSEEDYTEIVFDHQARRPLDSPAESVVFLSSSTVALVVDKAALAAATLHAPVIDITRSEDALSGAGGAYRSLDLTTPSLPDSLTWFEDGDNPGHCVGPALTGNTSATDPSPLLTSPPPSSVFFGEVGRGLRCQARTCRPTSPRSVWRGREGRQSLRKPSCLRLWMRDFTVLEVRVTEIGALPVAELAPDVTEVAEPAVMVVA